MDLKVVPKTVLHLAAENLRQAIFTGVFQPGERLVEADLCRRLDVSRASLREALRILATEKLITLVPNRGPSVAAISWGEAEEIYDVRAMLEGEAAFRAATRLDAAALRAMRTALADFERAVARRDPAGRLAATARFYDAMLGGCDSSVIVELLQGLVARITFLRARSMQRAGRSRESAAELRRLLAYLEARDAPGARRAAIDHVHRACAAARAASTGVLAA
ncbi:MAG: GntR family transcriptional regulator [bacterium]|jgi:DNA-binding GntR family transcriptional regulator